MPSIDSVIIYFQSVCAQVCSMWPGYNPSRGEFLESKLWILSLLQVVMFLWRKKVVMMSTVSVFQLSHYMLLSKKQLNWVVTCNTRDVCNHINGVFWWPVCVCVIHSNAELHTASQCTIPCSESVSRSNHWPGSSSQETFFSTLGKNAEISCLPVSTFHSLNSDGERGDQGNTQTRILWRKHGGNASL